MGAGQRCLVRIGRDGLAASKTLMELAAAAAVAVMEEGTGPRKKQE